MSLLVIYLFYEEKKKFQNSNQIKHNRRTQEARKRATSYLTLHPTLQGIDNAMGWELADGIVCAWGGRQMTPRRYEYGTAVRPHPRTMATHRSHPLRDSH